MGRGSLIRNTGKPVVDVGVFAPTDEQRAVHEALLNGSGHVLVNAVAGSGKSRTITEYAKLERDATVGLVAFNKHIADELQNRMMDQRNVQCMTYHSLGYKAVRQAVGYLGRPDQYRVLGILDNLNLPVSHDKEKVVKYRTATLVSLAKQYGYKERKDLEWLMDWHDIDANGETELILNTVPKVLRLCAEVRRGDSIDFDDMVWLPGELQLAMPKFDVLCIDEGQDTGRTQHWLATQSAGKLCVIGDKNQAIYQWRGADADSMGRLESWMTENGGCTVLPLTLTRRCPKSHVRLAQTIVHQIHALEDAPEGEVRYMGMNEACEVMRPGDLVVCRVNAELMGCAYRILKRGVKVVVRGRDIGKGLVRLIEEGEKQAGREAELREVLRACERITQLAVEKFNMIANGRGEARAMAAVDKYECVVELGVGSTSVQELKSVIGELFADFEADGTPKHAVVLGTVHRTKGLEANRVFVLRPDLMPHKMARKPHERVGELNLAYVAVTRAKFVPGNGESGVLVFVGGESPLFRVDQDQTWGKI